MKYAYVTVVVWFVFPTQAMSQKCDPLTHLQQDTRAVELKNAAALVYQAQIENSTEKRRSKAGKVSFVIDGIDASLGTRTIGAINQKIRERKLVDYKDSSYKSLLISTLSPSAVSAYKACLRNPGIEITYGPNAHKGARFFVNVKWHANPFATEPAKMTISVLNGKARLQSTSSSSYSVTTPIKKNGTRTFTITERLLTEKTQISVSVESNEGISTSEEAYIPPYLPFNVDVKARTSAKLKVSSKYGRYQTDKKSICVTANEGFILVPNTAKWVIGYERNNTTKRIDAKSTVEVCGTLTARGQKHRATIIGKIHVQQVRIVPIEVTTSTRFSY